VRAVIDTNVLIAGLLWHGSPDRLLTQVRGGVLGLVSSPALPAELADVLGRSKFDAVLKRSNTSRDGLLAEIRQLAEVIEPPPLPQPMCRDPDNDEVLALALAARAELIVSGDADRLVLRQFEGVPVVNPAQALQHIGIV
jgi:putative PIN family toxin of toxin-antitoxin system